MLIADLHKFRNEPDGLEPWNLPPCRGFVVVERLPSSPKATGASIYLRNTDEAPDDFSREPVVCLNVLT